jgi:hypothetical protein
MRLPFNRREASSSQSAILVIVCKLKMSFENFRLVLMRVPVPYSATYFRGDSYLVRGILVRMLCTLDYPTTT